MGFCMCSWWRYRSMILIFIDRFYYRPVDRHRKKSVDRHRHLHHRPSLIYISFVNFVYRTTRGERRGDLTPAARLQFATNTLGQESARTNPSPPLTTSTTLELQLRARNAETVRLNTRGTTMTAYSTTSGWGFPSSLHGSSTQTRSDAGPQIRPRGMFVELGMGNMAINPHVLYPELVRQFMAKVNVYYASEREKRANEGILTFFIRGIRYRVPLSALNTIYGFQNGELQHAFVPDFAGRSTFWGHIATGFFDSGSAL